MIVYKYRCIEDVLDNGKPILHKFGDSSRITKWSEKAGTIFLDNPRSIKALNRQASLARRFNKGNPQNLFPKVKCEIVKFELNEIK